MTVPVSLAASPEGAWLARRTGTRLSLHPTHRLGETKAIELDTDDVDIAFAGPPDQLVVVVRGATATQVLLYNPPDLEVAAHAEIEGRAELAAVTGPRLALITGEHRNLVLVRCAPRALVVQPTDAGPLVELVVGLDGNRILVCQPKKLEQWDAVARRPMLRLHLPLPPPPRWVGAAKGSFWAARPGRDDVQIFRASDGRAFDHRLGANVVAVGANVASTQVVFATESGLVRVHAFAHTTVAISSRVAVALAQTVVGDEANLYGCDPDGALWRLALDESVQPAAAAVAPPEAKPKGGFVLDIAKPAVSKVVPARAQATITPITKARPAGGGERAWRDGLARWSAEAIARGERGERADEGDPSIPFDAAIAGLGDRVPPIARRALVLLYGAWLRGGVRVSIAAAASALGGDDEAWAEALGTGALGELGWVAIETGRIALVPPVARHLDGAAPRAVRVMGDPPAQDALRGVSIARPEGGAADHDLDALALKLGAIAVLVAGAGLDEAALEARLHETTLVVPPDAAKDADIAALAARGGDALVLVATDAPLPAALAALPTWPA